MSDKPVFSTAATLDPTASIASTNKVLSNTYWLLGLTLAFSALTATFAVAINLPQSMALVLMIVGFVLLFVVHKMADSAKGLPGYFCLHRGLGRIDWPNAVVLSRHGKRTHYGPAGAGGHRLGVLLAVGVRFEHQERLFLHGRVSHDGFDRGRSRHDRQYFSCHTGIVANALRGSRDDHGRTDSV